MRKMGLVNVYVSGILTTGVAITMAARNTILTGVILALAIGIGVEGMMLIESKAP